MALADSPKLFKNDLIADKLNEVKIKFIDKTIFESLGEMVKCS